ncbi:MAG: hypothetical protein PHS60_07115 [Zavarzinia sp.]|nr:hypothetical protein [Zavarzinia sp.]
MNMSATGTARPHAYTPAVQPAAIERPGERENDGDSDDAAAATAVSAAKSALTANLGRLIDQSA